MKPDTLAACMNWKTIVEENCDLINNKVIPMLLLQNKADLLDNPSQGTNNTVLSEDDLNSTAVQHGFIAGLRVSAKRGDGLDKAFNVLLDEIERRLSNGSVLPGGGFGNSFVMDAKRQRKHLKGSILLSTQQAVKKKPTNCC